MEFKSEVKESEMLRIVHGSPGLRKDSHDLDVVYLFKELPDFETCRLFCSADKKENRNILVLQDGFVKSCFKGLPDECNNSILSTWRHHLDQNKFEPENFPIRQKIIRNVPLKVVRTIRGILTRVTRSDYRTEIKSALKSYNFSIHRQTIAKVDFTHESITKLFSIEDCKAVSFHFAQCILLIKGAEIYTKGETKSHFPILIPFIDRKPECLAKIHILNQLRDELVSLLDGVDIISLPDNLNIFIQNGKKSEKNVFYSQSNGIIIDMSLSGERCIYFPPEIVLSDSDALLHIFEHKGKIQAVMNNKLENGIVEKLQKNFPTIESLDFKRNHYLFLFKDNLFQLIGKRDNVSNDSIIYKYS